MKIGASLEAITGRSLDARNLQRTLSELIASVVAMVKEHSLQVVELPLDAVFIYPALFTKEALFQMRRVAEANSFRYTAHLPYMWLDLSSINEVMRQASVCCVLEGLRRVQNLAPLTYPLHLMAERAEAIATSTWTEPEKQAFLARMLEQAERSLEEIVQEVEPTKLCLENSGAVSFEPILTLAKKYNISLCLDVGHLALQGGDPVAFIEAHFEAIKEVHLHDVIRVGWAKDEPVLMDHQPLGSGSLNLEGIIGALKTRGYDGVLLVEVLSKDDLYRSLAILKALI
jgi:sugar phosphate isomerase/epimerase